jgi:hypothetical protein
MNVGTKLQAWLGDRQRQRRTQAAIEAFRHGWGHGEAHRRFDAAMAALPAHDAQSVAQAIHAIFRDDRCLDSLLGGLVAAMQGDPYFDPPFRVVSSDIHSGLTIFEDDNVTVAAGVSHASRLAAKKSAPRGPTSITFTGHVGLLKFVSAGGARLSFWEAPGITGEFSAATAGRCTRTGERLLEDGEIVTVDGRFQSYVIEHAQSNLVVLQASIKRDQAPLRVEYDSATGDYVGCSAGGDGVSRIQMLTTLLRKLDCDGAFEGVAAFLDHPDFFVRWHVMRELLGIDAQAALPHLKRMAARDPHPDARRAARKVLDGLDAAPRASKAA